MPQIDFSHYYTYDELTTFVHTIAEEHPTLAQVESIGKSHEGRDIWVVTVTNLATGLAREKPASILPSGWAPRTAALVLAAVTMAWVAASSHNLWPLNQSLARSLSARTPSDPISRSRRRRSMSRNRW